MQTDSSEPSVGGGTRLERAIVMQLLRDDHLPQWSRAELCEELAVGADALDAALPALNGDGILCVAGERLSASRAVRKLDELELIAV